MSNAPFLFTRWRLFGAAPWPGLRETSSQHDPRSLQACIQVGFVVSNLDAPIDVFQNADSLVVPDVDIGAVVEQDLDDKLTPESRRNMQSGLAIPVACLQLRARIDQPFDDQFQIIVFVIVLGMVDERHKDGVAAVAVVVYIRFGSQ